LGRTLFLLFLGLNALLIDGAQEMESRGLLGLMLADVIPAEGQQLSRYRGSEVIEVTPGLPAERSGMERGDIILAVDDTLIESTNQLQILVSKLTPGEVITVKVARGDRLLDIPVRIASWESFLLEKPGFGFFSSVVQLAPLNDALRTRYNISPSVQGLVIISVDEQSIYQTILEEGTVIRKVNNRLITSENDLWKQFRPGLNRLEILEGGVVGSLAIRGY